jgi:hypothetical protein
MTVIGPATATPARGETSTDAPAIVPALLIGLIAFFIIRGPATLGPTSILWLDQYDQAMHTLGWWFFRDAPWGWPPGASPLYGLEIASGVGLSDSLPLFAFPFKLLSPWLSKTFQYWGYWHLLSFMLQAMFAALIAHELRLSRPMALLAAILCVFQPAFLARLDVHMALSGHWTILAAIWLYLRRDTLPAWAWPLLLATVSAIHGYLMAMVFAIWAASLLQRFWQRRLRPAPTLVEIGLTAVTMAIVLWAVGILMVSSVGSWGFGQFRMNLLGPFNPDKFFSFVVPGVTTNVYEWEGINYIGLGIFAGMAVALITLRRDTIRPLLSSTFLPLIAAVLAMAIFALSHRVAFGSIELFRLPLPDWLEKFFNIFRSSGRMFWPLGYLIIFGTLTLISRQVRASLALAIAAACVLIQIVDTQRGWRSLYVGENKIGASFRTALVSPVWEALAPHYQRVRNVPVENEPKFWRELSWYAETHGMATDAAYLGRVDPTALANANSVAQQALVDGSFDTGAVYALDEASAAKAEKLLQPGDLLARIDGVIVFARGGKTVLDTAGIPVPDFTPEPIPGG